MRLCRYQYYPVRDICAIRYIVENTREFHPLRDKQHSRMRMSDTPCADNSFHSILVIVSTRIAAYNNRAKIRFYFYGRYPPSHLHLRYNNTSYVSLVFLRRKSEQSRRLSLTLVISTE